ncbi:MAG: hypothetical protein HQL03_03765 [Nitrospirae bacterium]|nr:hypothetical protein [Nitrospirota bacterium]
MKKQYDPNLIWAATCSYADKFDRPPQKKLQIFIYRKDVQEGAFFISIGKLYWDDIVGDGYHSKIEQNSLEQHANLLEEVVLL